MTTGEGMTELLVPIVSTPLDSYSQGNIEMGQLPSRVHERLTNHLGLKPRGKVKFPGPRMLRHRIWLRIPFLLSHPARL
jgi:hypothetical protein